MWVELVVLVNVTNKLIKADSPLEDISGCRKPKGFLDILAGFYFYLFYIQSFIWTIAILNKRRFYAYPGLFYICFKLELQD